MAVHSLGKHYYKDDKRGYYYDFFDEDVPRKYRYFRTLKECQEDVQYRRSCSMQYEELRREGW